MWYVLGVDDDSAVHRRQQPEGAGHERGPRHRLAARSSLP
jgi:hypothetical protein